MPSFVTILPSPRGHYANVLSALLVDAPKNVSLLESSYTLSLLRLQHPHLLLQRLHLLIEFRETPFDVTEMMDLGYEGAISDVCECIVNACRVGEVELKGGEVLRGDTRDVGDIEYGGSVNHTLENLTSAIEHPIHIGIVGHFDADILGGDGAAVTIDDVKGDVGESYVGLKFARDRGLTPLRLDSDRVSLPGMVESDRACF